MRTTRREFLGAAALALREDSIARVVEREIPSGEYLLLRVADGSAVAERWSAPGRPAPLASLAKPFLAVEYARTHEHFPLFMCEAGRCWPPRGHGTLGIEEAIAHSCNAYFAALSTSYVEAAPPVEIARAFAGLAQRRTEPAVRRAYAGMRLAARSGTAAAVRARIAAKTGTARCSHQPRSSGDGLLAALFPEDAPEYVLLVRRCGSPGAATAKACAPVFRALGYAL